MSDERPGPVDRRPLPHRPIPENLLVGMVAVAFAVLDALLVHRNGRPLPAALAAGAVMGVFVFYGLRWFRRRLAARAAPPAPTPEGYVPPAAGGWANPRTGQKLAGRFARILKRPGSETRNPLAGRGAPPGRGPDRRGPERRDPERRDPERRDPERRDRAGS